MITEVLGTFLSDFGVTVVWNGVTSTGILDMPDQLIENISLSTEYSVTAKYSDFGGAVHGDTIVVDSINYQVRDARKIDDGKFVRIILQKV